MTKDFKLIRNKLDINNIELSGYYLVDPHSIIKLPFRCYLDTDIPADLSRYQIEVYAATKGDFIQVGLSTSESSLRVLIPEDTLNDGELRLKFKVTYISTDGSLSVVNRVITPGVIIMEDAPRIENNIEDYCGVIILPYALDSVDERCLTFRSLQNGSIIGLNKISNNQVLEYSLNKRNWNPMMTSTSLILNSGDEVYVRGILSGNNSSSDYTNFIITGEVDAVGNCNYLWNYEDTDSRLWSHCGYKLFSNCAGLISAPDLPSDILSDWCYTEMFRGCSLLNKVPQRLPAMSLTPVCYAGMFLECTSLTTAPELPATNLNSFCYQNMFIRCTSLLSAPELPSDSLAYACYYNMFKDCTSLVNAPELAAVNLVESCYDYMFQGCTSLVNAPELPATTLAYRCYRSMFDGCTSLVKAPLLPATRLISECYSGMFRDCTSLNYIKCLATNISASNCLSLWTYNVAPTGTFVKDPSNTFWQIDSPNGIPIGWTIQDYVQAVKFTAQQVNSTIGLQNLSSYQILEYSTNGREWNPMTTATTITLANNGDSCYIRGLLSANNTVSDYTQFRMTGRISTSGNYNYLWDYEDPDAPLKEYCGYNMFNSCTSLTTTSELPATTLASNCYHSMFQGCTSLTEAPELPATELADHCYNSMFWGCTSLITAPELSATTLADSCYRNMLRSCTSLTTAPDLPATTLSANCYYAMFVGCTSLTTAPELPATELVEGCYSSMFYGCESLTTAPELPATTLATNCYYAMFCYCYSLKNVPAVLPATNLVEGEYDHPLYSQDPSERNIQGCYRGMFFNCTSLEYAPILPALKLKTSCYVSMFGYCTKLKEVFILAGDVKITNGQNDYVNKNAACLWMFRGSRGEGIEPANPQDNPERNVVIHFGPGGTQSFRQMDNYYSHNQYFYAKDMTPDEVNEIIERYHIVYDD